MDTMHCQSRAEGTSAGSGMQGREMMWAGWCCGRRRRYHVRELGEGDRPLEVQEGTGDSVAGIKKLDTSHQRTYRKETLATYLGKIGPFSMIKQGLVALANCIQKSFLK